MFFPIQLRSTLRKTSGNCVPVITESFISAVTGAITFYYIILEKEAKKQLIEKSKRPKQNEMIIYHERSLQNIMKTWNNYKEHVKATEPENQQLITSIEEQSAIISEIIKQRNALGLSQRDLASMCKIPQSSIARMESLQTTPSLSTLLKIMKPLGLHLTVTKQLPVSSK